MKISALALTLLEFIEDYAEKAYPDPGGIWTIGYGHTGHDVVEGLVCTEEQADVWLQQDLLTAEQGVEHFAKVPLTQRQFDALVLFAFNLGVSALSGSTLLRLVNGGNTEAAAEEFIKWINVKGTPNRGLKRRRRVERALFLDGAQS